MPLPREISSLPLTNSQQKSLTEKGIQIVSEISNSSPDVEFNIEELTKAPETKIASQLLMEEKSMRDINSFLDNLDVLLKGVLRPGLVTEFVGLPGSGRTQLCAQIIDDSLYGVTIYICSNLDFSITRLREIIGNYKKSVKCFKDYDETVILKNIQFIDIMSSDQLLECLEFLNEFGKEHKNITLVIIDSITYPLRLCESNEKTSLICFIITELRNLAKKYNFSVVMTNDMTTIVGSSGNEVVPSLRDTFYHMINNRILLSQKDNIFEAEILKASTKFPVKCNYKFLDDVT
ncbi:DNA repair protein RAD51 homolog 3-like isoform X2 [Coccinella septempunctata]|uniref:DNA repair protein RAD51 homolog 3-like isoform X2 n=1 Tax=Coccinella septempunctata TaxID=41139 RepID=UPI001D0986FE|nr:DNA repair protein RAD51 homolog 3-like isoform X2 [Coccinella septempunctata]